VDWGGKLESDVFQLMAVVSMYPRQRFINIETHVPLRDSTHLKYMGSMHSGQEMHGGIE
jgi:hypothetical protein